ncbi:nitrous oxide reductase family maturation protein NosD [Gracilimonas sediminicola]|uniref:Nitrous oxide reductase family maturation protein NosD n=1 Tax=Gracilimonas sediminicola TaxID=2952158 RepID=A0A9X2L0J1_9BACT|nr:nitrous oxide reductase family maturation protein NosD [Gracilimonas sediminicola]MCP9290123.1 nitrous oxide reductase family maturation protein NosD [Gracilimonas sediminicola]
MKGITFIAIAALLGLSSPKATAQPVTVSAGGEIPTIAEGLKLTQSYDTLHIKQGTYLEHNLVVDKPITIIGHNRPVIDGEKKGFILVITADDVTVKGLEIRNTSTSFMEDYAGILIEKTKNTLIEDIRLIDNFFGIYLAETDKAVIRNNYFSASGERETSSGNGIHLWYSKDTKIENNYVRGHRDGLYFEFVDGAYIRNNVSEDNIRYGIHFMYSDNCSYLDNTFRNNGGGVAVMYTSNVEIIGNRFEDNWGSSAYGMLLKEINRSRILDNHFENNSVGLYIEATSRNEVKGNTFKQNGWAIKLMANSTDNVFSENNFLANSFEVSTNSRRNFNEFTGNYWSQYEGYDLDRDGVGDVPHHPVRLFTILVEKQPQSLLLLRSLLIDILDAAEKVMPALTPETLIDIKPQMDQLK